jgi:hypothetical protein
MEDRLIDLIAEILTLLFVFRARRAQTGWRRARSCG